MTPHRAARRTRRLLPLATLLLAGSLTLSGCEIGNSPADSPSRTAPASGGGTALRAVGELTVKGRAPKTGYDRDKFGSPWLDTDHNGCGTRDDILADQLDSVSRASDGCKVLRGVLDPDPYTGTRITFIRGRSKVDIDHLVALSDAWQKGAQQWSDSKRRAFANDPLNLVAADSSTNRQKGDGDTATWLPPNKSYRCDYVAGQVSVKTKYQLWVTRAEKDAMAKVLAACPNQKLPSGGSPTEVAAP
ncbi:HNH endonuclease family protein [Streptomyces albicerus]|uniref:HNH endonuclease family protein n=1 Tax=Streptomyces albicerus TaxID=2569859 RepID=UPI001CEDA00D|nr:HNH endonuclease family protein [Streptomyces albicerus]